MALPPLSSSADEFGRPTVFGRPTGAEAVAAVLAGRSIPPVVRAHPQTTEAVAESVARYGGSP